MKRIDRKACFGGWQDVYTHDSDTLGCTMQFGVYLPPAAAERALPVVYWLSGLTCTEQNFVTKAGAQRYAAEHDVIVVAPDTSPRGEHVADDEGWDLGKGAGFYVNATEAPWAANYHMADYVHDELPALIAAHFDVTDKRSIMGHSMGGHGALVLALKNPGAYQSVSAFAPIVAPMDVPWGEKAFTAYLGADRSTWAAWDTCALVKAYTGPALPLLVEQGEDDGFLAKQLQPERLEQACAEAGHPLTLHRRAGYDHSYYFIASFIGAHMAHHAAALHGGA